MEKKKITVTIKDKDGKVLLEYSEPVEISRGAMENITWIKKGVWTIKELLNINISQELDKAREEGRREVLEDMKKMWDNDNLGDAPKYGSAGAGLMKRWIRDDINERLSKLTTK